MLFKMLKIRGNLRPLDFQDPTHMYSGLFKSKSHRLTPWVVLLALYSQLRLFSKLQENKGAS